MILIVILIIFYSLILPVSCVIRDIEPQNWKCVIYVIVVCKCLIRLSKSPAPRSGHYNFLIKNNFPGISINFRVVASVLAGSSFGFVFFVCSSFVLLNVMASRRTYDVRYFPPQWLVGMWRADLAPHFCSRKRSGTDNKPEQVAVRASLGSLDCGFLLFKIF